ncbi:unnamed protein product [Rhizoctonia solani]|uniref:HAT C-terminal dimerisation domain-containing protein n=1 Tax=Rhizoctonia solani TaxID=456999 RepID=A0A8H3HVA6_9AGAM|nr:unnamed protein product [Rhizoctonia solani]
MPRPLDEVWEHYYTDNSKYGQDQSHKNAWCLAEIEKKEDIFKKEDRAAKFWGDFIVERDPGTLRNQAIETMRPVCGKVDLMINHLMRCQHVSSEVKFKVGKEKKSREQQRETTRAFKDAVTNGPTITTKSAERYTYRVGQAFSETAQEDYARDWCDVIVACGFPWNCATNPVLKRFVQQWDPGASMPSRPTLSNHILAERAQEVENQAQKSTQGKLAMGQCDGWKSIARQPLVAMLMTVEEQSHILDVHHVGADKKTAENLLNLIKLTMKRTEEKYGIKWIGWCTDAGSDAHKARRLLHNEMPHLINPHCAAHLINLLVGDYFKIKVDFISAATKAQNVIRWFNNHSRALAWLQNEQKHLMGKTLSLLYPALTRWTSVDMALQRPADYLTAFQGLLLRHPASEFQEVAGSDRKSREKAMEIRGVIEDNQFWADITRITFHLKPLTIAAYATEGTSTRLDQVLLTLANLYRFFSKLGGDNLLIGQTLCSRIEKRFEAFDQDVSILAVFLNPYIRANLFNRQSSSGEFLCAGMTGLAIRVWRRLYQKADNLDPDLAFVNACSDYYNWAPNSIFSPEKTHLDMLERLAHAEGQEVNVIEVWRRLDDDTFAGRNWLVKLAIHVLSVVSNSAGCERLFSQMGYVQTKHRSRLEVERVRNTVVLKNALMHEYQPRIRGVKRKFCDLDCNANQDAESAAVAEPHNVTTNSDHIELGPGSLGYSEDYKAKYDATLLINNPAAYFTQLTQRLINDTIEEDAAATTELEAAFPRSSNVQSEGRDLETTCPLTEATGAQSAHPFRRFSTLPSSKEQAHTRRAR